MTIAAIREALASAVEAALDDEAWLVTSRIPSTPDDPAVYVRFPTARRSTLGGVHDHEISVTFVVGLTDTDLAQEALEVVYDEALWSAIERYDTDAWEGLRCDGIPDEPYQLELDDGSKRLAVDLTFTIAG